MTAIVSTELRVLERGIELLTCSTSRLRFMFTTSIVTTPLDITAVINVAGEQFWLSF
jgi:hypothetical protein